MPRVTTRNTIKKGEKYKNGKPKKPSWEYRFEGARINGKRQQISKAGFRTKKEAELAGAKALAEYQNAGQTFRATELSVSDYMDEWFEKYCMKNLRHNTQLIYKQVIKKHIKPKLGKYKLESLTPAVLQAFTDDLNADGHAKAHIERINSTLSAALNYAVFPLQYIKDSPMRFVKMPKQAREGKKKIVITKDDYKRLIERFPFGNRYHIPIMLGYHCGLRTGEVCGLTWNDIDFENKTLTINKQALRRVYQAKTDIGFVFGKTKTKASNRTIALDDILLEELKKEKQYQEFCEKRLKDFYNVQVLVDTEYGKRIVTVPKDSANGLDRIRMVCINDCGHFTSHDNLKTIQRPVKKELGLDKFDFHTLRHTHATMLIEAGVSPKNVQHRLGHDDIKTTLDTYVKNTKKMDVDSIKLFEQLLVN